jgi:two-component system response regulator
MNERPLEILLVEDCGSDEELTLLALRRQRLANSIHVVRDGAEALDFFARSGRHARRSGRDPGLVLLDLRLPKVSGLDVLRRLKSDPSTREIRVVALVSSMEEEHFSDLHHLGVDGVLVKPLTFEGFMELVVRFDLQWLLVHGPQTARRASA